MSRTEKALGELGELVDQAAQPEKRREVLVARARAAGATWAQLAEVLGVSVQAAHRRYHDLRYDTRTARAWREQQMEL